MTTFYQFKSIPLELSPRRLIDGEGQYMGLIQRLSVCNVEANEQ